MQRQIVAEALQYVKPDEGRLVYMTQSILDEENAKQVGEQAAKCDIPRNFFISYRSDIFV